MPLKTLIGLIVCNLAWALNPTMSKWVLSEFSPAHTALLRFAGATVSYLVAILFFHLVPGFSHEGSSRRFAIPSGKGTLNDWMLLTGLGFMAFCFAPVMAMLGLNQSRATDNSLIIAMEPLVTVLLAGIFLREPLRRRHAAIFAIALVGFAFLTELTPEKISSGFDNHLIGNLVILLSLVGEGSYSIFGRKLMVRHSASGVFGTSLLIGFAILTLGTLSLAGLPQTLPGAAFTAKSVLGILWLGPIGTTISYLYWMMALSEASVASIALTLFVQPVFGPLWGYLFLGERMTPMQGLGASLILGGVFLHSILEIRQYRTGHAAT